MSLLEARCDEGVEKETWTDSKSYILVFSVNIAGLPENTIRDLNDEVNRLIRSKGHWEHRIRELGGVILDMADQNDTGSDDDTALFIGGGNTYKCKWLISVIVDTLERQRIYLK